MKRQNWWAMLILMAGLLSVAGVALAGVFDLPPFEDRYPYRAFYKHPPVDKYVRRTVEIPPGPIFSAIARVNWNGVWYINGKELAGVYRRIAGGGSMYWIFGADIKPYLRPGKNVFATNAGWYGYLDAKVIMADGTVIAFGTDDQCRVSQEDPEGWTSLNLEDSAWSLEPGRTRVYFSDRRTPPYCDRLIIENPYQEKLFYSDRREAKFTVRVPVGLARPGARLSYLVKEVPSGKEITRGEIAKFAPLRDKASAACDISAGKLPRGVYVLSLEWKQDGQVIEKHENEPFVVAGRIPQKEVAGNSFEEGLDLKLLDTIECADPNDPHPFRQGGEGTSRIVQREGLHYRECPPAARRGPKGSSWFGYKVSLPEVDVPYVFVFEYPDDAARAIEFQVNEMPADPKKAAERGNVWCFHRESGGVLCGDLYPNSGRMRKFRILCYPGSKEVILTVTTGANGKPGAASKLQVYRLLNDLPALKVRQAGRMLGKMTERGYSYFKPFDGAPSEKRDTGNYFSPEVFAYWFKTAERMAQYLKFCGENTYSVGCFQYNWNNTPYVSPQFVGKTSRLEPDYREVLAAVFQENDLNLLATLEVTGIIPRGSPPSDEEVKAGADTPWCVSRQGKQMISNYAAAGGVPNLLHPTAQKYWGLLVDEICQKLVPFSSFKGFWNVECPGVEGFVPGHPPIWRTTNPETWLEWGFEDITVALFEKETKTKIPVDAKDPDRFAKRYQWIMNNAKEPWLHWRCQKMRDLRLAILERTRSHRKDLIFIVANEFWDQDVEVIRKSGIPLREWFRYDGQDLSLYRDLEGIHFARYITTKRNFTWPEDIEFYHQAGARFMYVKNIFVENPIYNEYTDEWPFKAIWIAGPTEAAGEHFGYQFARTAADSDPDHFIFGFLDDQFLPGHEQEIREFAKGFVCLPPGKMEKLAGSNFDDNISLRIKREKERLIVSLINLGWWKSQVKVSFSGAKRVINLTTGEAVSASGNTFMVSLPPYACRSFALDSAEAKITATEGKPADPTAARQPLQEWLDRAKQAFASSRTKRLFGQEETQKLLQQLAAMQADLATGRLVAVAKAYQGAEFQQRMAEATSSSPIIPWMVIGPFMQGETDTKGLEFKRAHPVEQDILSGKFDPSKAYQGMDRDRKPAAVKWQRLLSAPGDYPRLDFRQAYPMEWTIVYAYTNIHSPREQAAILSLGSDDGARVWVNGELVIDHFVARGFAPDQDMAKVKLRKGWNQILVKVEQRLGAWLLGMVVRDQDGKPLEVEYSPEAATQ